MGANQCLLGFHVQRAALGIHLVQAVQGDVHVAGFKGFQPGLVDDGFFQVGVGENDQGAHGSVLQ
ncbi:hypothetical protein D3C77_777330 [compost metagenome]